jgi:hypothetical protein
MMMWRTIRGRKGHEKGDKVGLNQQHTSREVVLGSQ